MCAPEVDTSGAARGSWCWCSALHCECLRDTRTIWRRRRRSRSTRSRRAAHWPCAAAHPMTHAGPVPPEHAGPGPVATRHGCALVWLCTDRAPRKTMPRRTSNIIRQHMVPPHTHVACTTQRHPIVWYQPHGSWRRRCRQSLPDPHSNTLHEGRV